VNVIVNYWSFRCDGQNVTRKTNWQRRAVMPSGKALDEFPVPAPETGFNVPL
jgi:hypothetical protein